MTQIIQLVDSRINTGERLLESSKFIWDMVMRGVILIIMQLVYCVIVFRLRNWNCLLTSVFFLFCFLPKQTNIPKRTSNFSLHFCQCYACLLIFLYLLVWSMCKHTHIFQCYMCACLLKKFCIFLMLCLDVQIWMQHIFDEIWPAHHSSFSHSQVGHLTLPRGDSLFPDSRTDACWPLPWWKRATHQGNPGVSITWGVCTLDNLQVITVGCCSFFLSLIFRLLVPSPVFCELHVLWGTVCSSVL